MRLWHKDLIKVLPDKQLVAQWRELAAIARKIILRGTPQHGLVNKVLDYPVDHFIEYSRLVKLEMNRRNKKTSPEIEDLLFSKIVNYSDLFKGGHRCNIDDYGFIYYGWHLRRYLRQCFYNLQEKADCGMVSKVDFDKILKTCTELEVI